MSKQPELPKEHQEWLADNGYKLDDHGQYVKEIRNGHIPENDNDIFGSWSVIIITPKDNGTYFSGIISYFTTVPEMGIMEVSLTRRLKECPTPKEAVEHTIKKFNGMLDKASKRTFAQEGFQE